MFQLKEKDSLLNDWETKYLTLKSNVESLQKDIASKERYLSDLPTPEEHHKNVHLVSFVNGVKLVFKINHLLNSSLSDYHIADLPSS